MSNSVGKHIYALYRASYTQTMFNKKTLSSAKYGSSETSFMQLTLTKIIPLKLSGLNSIESEKALKKMLYFRPIDFRDLLSEACMKVELKATLIQTLLFVYKSYTYHLSITL